MTVLTIPAAQPFLKTLAQLVLDECQGHPDRLADYTILLPTRRAERALRDLFLALQPQDVLLLPRMIPLGDVDDDDLILRDPDFSIPLPIPALERSALLARLVMRANRDMSPAQAVELAEALAKFLDDAHTHDVDLAQLATLVPENYAAHWGQTLSFLKIITEYWPLELQARGQIDPADYRNRLLRATAKLWRAQPPSNPVIAAGSIGVYPATADLLGVIAALPNGRVILPNLDQTLSDDVWDNLTPVHPQYSLQRLLQRMQITRAQVTAIGGPDDAPRAQLWRSVMLPAAETVSWRHDVLPGAATQNLVLVECATSEEEAQVIALKIRSVLEQAQHSVALVTPDRDLAARVRAALRRYQIAVDDSGGQLLAAMPVGVYLQLLAQVAQQPDDWVAALGLIKHPLTAMGMARADCRAAVREFELTELREKSVTEHTPAHALLDRFRALAAEWLQLMQSPASHPLSTYVTAHIKIAETMAARADEPRFSVWDSDDGAAAHKLLQQLLTLDEMLSPILAGDYAEMMAHWLGGIRVRPTYNLHPRVHIWGVLEAQLQYADHIIIGGFNEGHWPPADVADPWLSRPMREKLGLPVHEHTVGIAAHDITQLTALPDVIMTRTLRAGGTPQLPSRWLLRLEAVLNAQGRQLAEIADHRWQDWLRQLDTPAAPVTIAPPRPTPSASARPRRLSVTAIETLRRDPYSIYARYILKLGALEPLNPDPGAAERGMLIHSILAEFLRRYPAQMPPQAYDDLLSIARDMGGPALLVSAFGQFFWPRFMRHAQFFIDTQQALLAQGRRFLAAEIKGQLAIATGAGEFLITATADRIDRTMEGDLVIIDYKTGRPPKYTDMENGYAPQLPLEAIIAQAGGFAGIAAAPVAGIEVWQLSNGDDKYIDVDTAKTMRVMATTAPGVAALLAHYLDAATPYLAMPRPDHAPRFNDYAQLARVKEWGAL